MYNYSKTHTCQICGVEYIAKGVNSKFCSHECKREHCREYDRGARATLSKRLSNLNAGAKCRSAKYNRPYNLSVGFLRELWKRQQGKCIVTGEVFNLEHPGVGKHLPNSPSLDQIDAGKGYTKDNVRLVTYQCNVALNQWGEERLKEFAKMVTDNERS